MLNLQGLCKSLVFGISDWRSTATRIPLFSLHFLMPPSTCHPVSKGQTHSLWTGLHSDEQSTKGAIVLLCLMSGRQVFSSRREQSRDKVENYFHHQAHYTCLFPSGENSVRCMTEEEGGWAISGLLQHSTYAERWQCGYYIWLHRANKANKRAGQRYWDWQYISIITE